MRLFRRNAARAGLPPGTLTPAGEKKAEPSSVNVMRYSPADGCSEKRIDGEEIGRIEAGQGVMWLNCDGLGDVTVIEGIGRRWGIHDLVLEDICHTDQRPKVEDHGDYLFVVLKMIYPEPGGDDMQMEQVALILKDGVVLSFQERAGDVFDTIRTRIRDGKGRIRRMKSDYLAYSLMDAIVDNYFVVMERIGDRIEALEESVIRKPDAETSARIHELRRKILLLRRSVRPLREVVNSLVQSESGLVTKPVRPFFRDLYDHTIQIIDNLELSRDFLSGMLDIYLSSMSNRTNEVMKVLTIIATLFIPLSFLVGVYGMNFQHMPELQWPWSYPVLWGIMLLTTIGFLTYFKKKRWL